MTRGRTLTAMLLVTLAALPGPAVQAQARPLLGTVQRGWISRAQAGAPVHTATRSVAALYANFVWRRTPTAGLPLEMQWVGPQGFVRASWKSRTLRSDQPGTRLYSRVTSGVYGGTPGVWHVRLLVDDVVRGYLGFRVTG